MGASNKPLPPNSVRPRPHDSEHYPDPSGLGFRTALIYISAMLRMRKKPPADRPNINSGEPWSAFDLAELEELLKLGQPIADIADYLCRDVDEVTIEAEFIRQQRKQP
jgi:hypothetical protein